MDQTSLLVITISRQLGSGGAFIGQKLARNLNIFYADREIITQVARQFSVLEEDLESCDEKKSSFWQSLIQSYGLGFQDAYKPPQIIVPPDIVLFNAQARIIEHITKERSAVILGRCGSYILREHPNHLSIFLHADIAFRRTRIQKIYNVTGKVAEKMILQSDKERSLYHQSFTGVDWTDARQYDFSINTGKIGLENSAELIIKYLAFC
jgi:cytidylate kinase